jgi:hypothetical protein
LVKKVVSLFLILILSTIMMTSILLGTLKVAAAEKQNSVINVLATSTSANPQPDDDWSMLLHDACPIGYS